MKLIFIESENSSEVELFEASTSEELISGYIAKVKAWVEANRSRMLDFSKGLTTPMVEDPYLNDYLWENLTDYDCFMNSTILKLGGLWNWNHPDSNRLMYDLSHGITFEAQIQKDLEEGILVIRD